MRYSFPVVTGVMLPLLLAGPALAGITRVGTTAAPFLTIGLGSRALGMGGAYTGVAMDASCLYWNPGAAAVLEKSEALLVQTQYLADTDLNFFGLVTPAGERSSVGLSMTYLDYGELEVTTVEEPEGTGEFFRSSDLALGLTYSTRFTDRFSIGFTGKFVQQKIWHESASSVAFDVGTRFRTDFHNLVLGMGIYNVGMDMEMGGTDLLLGHDLDPNQGGDNPAVPVNLDLYAWPLPITFRMGASMYLIENPEYSLLVAADASHPVDNSESISVGGEYGYKNRFFLRGGWHNLFLTDLEGGLTLGGGLELPVFSAGTLCVDGAWEEFGRLGEVVKYSLRFKW
ncbi:MAG: PorV/PorQ family protein [Calditrichaeota bacterium]|nr:PorV/PorQ family protein [Calditrichota bacterium]